MQKSISYDACFKTELYISCWNLPTQLLNLLNCMFSQPFYPNLPIFLMLNFVRFVLLLIFVCLCALICVSCVDLNCASWIEMCNSQQLQQYHSDPWWTWTCTPQEIAWSVFKYLSWVASDLLGWSSCESCSHTVLQLWSWTRRKEGAEQYILGYWPRRRRV